MNYDYLHEVEFVELSNAQGIPRIALLPVFQKLGFKRFDDIVSLEREGNVPPWQAQSLVEVKVFFNDAEVYGFGDEDWDVLRLEYLFASLPFDLVATYVDVVFQVSESLKSPLLDQGKEINTEKLMTKFTQARDELLTEAGCDPGSEFLQIFIQSTYPRY